MTTQVTRFAPPIARSSNSFLKKTGNGKWRLEKNSNVAHKTTVNTGINITIDFADKHDRHNVRLTMRQDKGRSEGRWGGIYNGERCNTCKIALVRVGVCREWNECFV